VEAPGDKTLRLNIRLTFFYPTSGYPSLDLYRYVYLVRAVQNCLHPFKKWGRGTFGTFGNLLG
jgi:hypothetical protein